MSCRGSLATGCVQHPLAPRVSQVGRSASDCTYVSVFFALKQRSSPTQITRQFSINSRAAAMARPAAGILPDLVGASRQPLSIGEYLHAAKAPEWYATASIFMASALLSPVAFGDYFGDSLELRGILIGIALGLVSGGPPCSRCKSKTELAWRWAGQDAGHWAWRWFWTCPRHTHHHDANALSSSGILKS